MFVTFCTYAQGQNTHLYNVEPKRLVSYSLGFEFGSNYLDVGNLNLELLALDLLPVEPYTNNFTFQFMLGTDLFEAYSSLTLMSSAQFSRIIDQDQIFRSTSFQGVYIGVGLRKKLVSVFNDRLSLAVSIDANKARHFMNLSTGMLTKTSIDSLIIDSRTVMANSVYYVVQPSVEILYAVMNRKNRFDIGLRLGRFFNIEQEAWSNQHQMVIQGLSPMGNYDTYNFALKFLYTFNRDYAP
jgi:hypothetical protein